MYCTIFQAKILRVYLVRTIFEAEFLQYVQEFLYTYWVSVLLAVDVHRGINTYEYERQSLQIARAGEEAEACVSGSINEIGPEKITKKMTWKSGGR